LKNSREIGQNACIHISKTRSTTFRCSTFVRHDQDQLVQTKDAEKEERDDKARVLTIIGYFIMLVSVIFTLFFPVFGVSLRYKTNRTNPGRLLPLQTHYIYDKDKNSSFEVTYVFQCVALSPYRCLLLCTSVWTASRVYWSFTYMVS